MSMGNLELPYPERGRPNGGEIEGILPSELQPKNICISPLIMAHHAK
jgi:hypothetical protein